MGPRRRGRRDPRPHVWEVASGFPALSAHILVHPDRDCHGRQAIPTLLTGGTTWLIRRMANDFARQHRLRPKMTVLVYTG